MPVQFKDDKILFAGGQIAMDPACCCGCQCPSDLPDVLVVHYPYVSFPGDPHAGETEWPVTIRRPLPEYRDAPYNYEKLDIPLHVGNCCWYGEASAPWNVGVDSCGVVYLLLDPEDCQWKLSNALGTRPGAGSPLGSFGEYILNNYGSGTGGGTVVVGMS